TNHSPASELVSVGARGRGGQRVREAQEAYRAGEKEERARRDCHHGEDVAREAHRLSAASASFGGAPGAPTTKATDANAARRASASATSTTAAVRVAAETGRSGAMPAVPGAGAAMRRSTSPGPRRMRSSPSAAMSTTNPAAPRRNSAIVTGLAQGLAQQGFFDGELFRRRARDVET